MCKEVVLYTDGGIRGDQIAFGFSAIRSDDPREIVFGGAGLAGRGTSNLAEYTALIRGLKTCLDHGIRIVHIHSDSRLMVNQVNGSWQVRSEDLQRPHAEVARILSEFDEWTIKWIKRDKNSVADALVRDAFRRKGFK